MIDLRTRTLAPDPVVRAWWPVPLVLVLDQITPGMAAAGTLPPLAAAVFSVAHALPLRWREPRPIGAAAAVLGAALVQALLTGPTLAFGSWVALMIVAFAVANGTRRVVAVASLTSILLGVGVISVVTEPEAPVTDMVFPIVYFGGAWGAGRLVRSRRLAAARLSALADSLAREREETARLAVAAARGRMSREVHDIVAHSLSIIVLQAEAAEALLERQPAKVQRPLTVIQRTGRQALDELRRMLDVLGTDDVDAPLPGLSDLEELTRTFERAGLAIDLQVAGPAETVAPGLGLTVYRLVQESLTNVLKHTGGAPCRVRVTIMEGHVDVEVHDDGPPRAVGTSVPGAGRGLAGMRERVESYGGDFVGAPTSEGGFRVAARLPMAAEVVA
ncbi:sensor histidine kinase [Egicoccus sp. AB-alg2]|uniref:sensor histidine kinase n=1 Tax=Egicoccus sp. AB-alg2 TaxID=3242693 RepID=UPI00359E36CE